MAQRLCAAVRIRREMGDGLLHLSSGAEDIPLTRVQRHFRFESGAKILVKVTRRRDRLTAFVDVYHGAIVAPNRDRSELWARVECRIAQDGRMHDFKIVLGPKDEQSRLRYRRFRARLVEDDSKEALRDFFEEMPRSA
jgi:hypothetical protein